MSKGIAIIDYSMANLRNLLVGRAESSKPNRFVTSGFAKPQPDLHIGHQFRLNSLRRNTRGNT